MEAFVALKRGPVYSEAQRTRARLVPEERARAALSKGATVTKCKLCGAPLRWVGTLDDGEMSLDVQPVRHGSYYVLRQQPGEGTLRSLHVAVPVCGVTTMAAAEAIGLNEPRFTSHSDTCIYLA